MRWSAIAAGAVVNREGWDCHGCAGSRAPHVASGRRRLSKAPRSPCLSTRSARPVNLDPHRSSDYGGFWVMYPNVWGGFLRYDETGRIALDLAEKVVRSQDGLRYTMTIRQGATYASGNPVVADHFIASWSRALDPANLSPMATFMEPLQWLRRLDRRQRGRGARISCRGRPHGRRRAGGSRDLFPVILRLLRLGGGRAAGIAGFGETNFVFNGAGTGPWQFVEYQQDTQFVMEPNPNYYDPPSPSLTRIVWPIVNGPDAAQTALDLYRNENAASADVPLSLLADVQSDATLSAELVQLNNSQATIRSLAMDFRQPPFNDVRVRRAFGMAFDRDRYAGDLWRNLDLRRPYSRRRSCRS